MQRTHERIAEGIHRLGEIIRPSDTIMPLGFEGGVLYHLLSNYYEMSGFPCQDNLQNIVYISSKYNEFDTAKFCKILSAVPQSQKVYGLDMRTKTGSLGRMLRGTIEGLEGRIGSIANFYYTVVFDRNKHADISAFEEELSDKERLQWSEIEEEQFDKIIWLENGIWGYNISHDFIAALQDVKEIKRLM